MVMLVLAVCWALAGWASAQCGDFGFASYYQDNMVLQKGPTAAQVWGYASTLGDEVTLQIEDSIHVVQAVDGPTGRPHWYVHLDQREASNEAYTITVTSQGCSIEITNIVFGDIWFCSGQSNMYHNLQHIDDPEPDLDDTVNYPFVRTFFTALVTAAEPQYDLIAIQRGWAEPSRGNMASYSAVCWLFGKQLNEKLGYPIGLIASSWGGTRIEAWSSPDALYQCYGDAGPPPGSGANAASVLWNAMVHPFLPLPIFGAIWYQGESNADLPSTYCCTQPAMVDDWRDNWYTITDGQTDPEFSFGEVGLAGWRSGDISTGWPEFRWDGQTCGHGFTPNDHMHNIFMAVGLDLPDFDSPQGSIHPRYKRQIADRLHLGALQVAYGITQHGRFLGPFPSSLSLSEDRSSVLLEYDNNNVELDFRSTSGFEVCCSNQEGQLCSSPGQASWTSAPIVVQGTSSLELSNPCSNFVNGLRYIWRESPCPLEECAVYSVENSLPAPPYIFEGPIE